MLTRDEIVSVLSYDPETGIFRWRVSRGRQSAGSVAGTPKGDEGYIQIRVFNVICRANRLAWLIMTGEWPPEGMMVDHENRVVDDNRWGNLRLATPTGNSANQKIRKDNTSGYRGVYWHKASSLWQALVFSKGKSVSLGYFKTKEAAAEARRLASAAHYGAFAPEPPATT